MISSHFVICHFGNLWVSGWWQGPGCLKLKAREGGGGGEGYHGHDPVTS